MNEPTLQKQAQSTIHSLINDLSRMVTAARDTEEIKGLQAASDALRRRIHLLGSGRAPELLSADERKLFRDLTLSTPDDDAFYSDDGLIVRFFALHEAGEQRSWSALTPEHEASVLAVAARAPVTAVLRQWLLDQRVASESFATSIRTTLPGPTAETLVELLAPESSMVPGAVDAEHGDDPLWGPKLDADLFEGDADESPTPR